jgi:ATP-dependent DNA helicase RecG
VADLLVHLPMRYEHELPEQTIAEASKSVGAAHGSDANLAVRGEVSSIKAAVGRGRKSPFIATLQDATGTIKLTWFNAGWMRNKLHPGMNILAWGKAKRWGDYLDMVNPQWRELDTNKSSQKRDERYVPIYPATESLPSDLIAKAVDAVLDDALKLVTDHLHEDYRRKAALPGLAEAYRMMHRPRNEEEIAQGRRRLAFDELLMLQLGVMLKRQHRHDALHAPGLKHTPKIAEHIAARIPFQLTAGQKSVVKEIVADLAHESP